MTSETAVEMFVGGLVLDPHTQAPVIVLKDESGDVCLPIWIGVAEATSIASAIKQLNMARPLTHDLMHHLFGEVGVKLERVVITDLKESTYFAELVLSHGDKALIIDSRPSDAIALAVRSSAPIFVVQHVLDQAKMSISLAAPQEGEAEGERGQAGEEPPGGGEAQPGTDFSRIEKEKWEDILKELDPDDFKYKM